MVDWQLTVDCRDPARLVAFWAEVLGYVPAPPPVGFDTWNDWYRSVGVPDGELPDDQEAVDRLVDPSGEGPRIWFASPVERVRPSFRMRHEGRTRGGVCPTPRGRQGGWRPGRMLLRGPARSRVRWW